MTRFLCYCPDVGAGSARWVNAADPFDAAWRFAECHDPPLRLFEVIRVRVRATDHLWRGFNLTAEPDAIDLVTTGWPSVSPAEALAITRAAG